MSVKVTPMADTLASSRLRRPDAPTSPLPADARAALAAVIADMRNFPRAIIGDPAEVVHFLGRQARRLAGIRDMRVAVYSAAIWMRLARRSGWD